MAEAVSHANAFERVLHFLLALAGARAAIGKREFDVFVNGQVADQVEGLKDEANLAIANARALADGQLGDGLAVQLVIAFRRRIEQAENRQQRRLAAAGGASNRDIRSFLDLEMNLLERVRFHFIREEDFLHALHFDERAVCVRHCLSFGSVFVF